MMTEIIRGAFARRGVTHVGVCAFAAVLPLLEVRARSRLPQCAQSVIVCALPYYPGDYPQRNVARYAICDDYHTTGGALLQEICADLAAHAPGYRFTAFIDVSPIREVAAARFAGLGLAGLHGQLILPEFGAHVFVGCVVTDLALPADSPADGSCRECEACLHACPTGALRRGVLERERCRSYITQKRGKLAAWEQEQVRAGGFAWGCDACLDACPLNTAQITPLECLKRHPLPILSYDNLDEALRRKAYGYRGRAVLERNLHLLDG